MKKSVLIFVEQRDNIIQNVSLELISESKRLLKDEEVKVNCLYLGKKLTSKHQEALSLAGADEIFYVEDEQLDHYDTQNYTSTIEEVLNKTGLPDVLLIGSTLLGRDLAPRVSARLKTGLTADATILDYEVSKDKTLLLATRPALGGNIYATILCDQHIPQMSSVRPGVFAINVNPNNNANLTKLNLDLVMTSQVEVLSRTPIECHDCELDKAKIIVAGGRGVGNKINELRELSELVGGEMAVSRAVVDAQLAPKHQQVGQTGVNVKPSIYIAMGISGAIQHIAGMDKSELIIAVNTDPNALIFDVSHISIISDANRVIPLLIEKMKQLNNVK